MSQVNIDVIDVDYADVPKKSGKGSYGQLTVTFKNDEGKVESKKIFDFNTPEETFQKLKLAKKGDTFAIMRQKNDKGYWDWIDLATQTAPRPVTNVTNTPTRPSYETPEERAQRQVYIIRQSSISSAAELLVGQNADADEVIAMAKQFEAYVLGNPMADLEDDIPE